MGSRLVRFNFTPGENEQIEAIIKIPEEKRSVIHGIVKDHRNRVVKDAVVKLFEVLDPHDKCKLKPITHAFTDDCGQFLFGPLTACKHYAIKVWINNVKIRELIIHPDDCLEHCDDHYEESSSCKPDYSHKPDNYYKQKPCPKENKQPHYKDDDDDDDE